MTAPMQAGQLRRKLTIQQRPSGQDVYGFENGGWSVVLTTWGHVAQRQVSTFMQSLAGQTVPTNQYVITLRYPPSIAIKAGMQVVDGAAVYLIQNVVDVDERHRTLTLYATMVPAPGA